MSSVYPPKDGTGCAVCRPLAALDSRVNDAMKATYGDTLMIHAKADGVRTKNEVDLDKANVIKCSVCDTCYSKKS